jgi:zinc protease
MKIKYLTLLIISVMVVMPLSAQLDRSIRPEPGPAPAINIPTAKQFVLKNGLKVIVVENDKLPRVTYNLRLVYEAFPEEQYAGYSSIAGQMLRTGTSSKTKEQIDEAIDFIGASITTHSGGIYASSLSKHNETLLGLMSDILLNPIFPENEFESLKNRTLSNLSSQKGSSAYMMDLLSKRVVFGDKHPYGESETDQTIANISLELCKEFYNNYFRPNSAYLIIVGDVKAKKVKRQVEKYFGKWEAKSILEKSVVAVSSPEKRQVSLIDRPLAVQSSLRVGYSIDFKPNDKDRIAASVMNTILGGGMFRLNQNLRETHGYTYGAYSYLGRDNLDASFFIYTEVGNDVTEGAIQEILNEMYRITQEPVSDEELQTAKNYLTGTFALSLAEPRTIADFAFEIARYNLPQDYYVNYLKNLEAITAEDIQRVAKRFILPENCHVMVVGKADDISANIKKFAMDNKIHYYDQEGNPIVESKAKTIPDGFTADDVMDKYLEAIGGKENLGKMVDFKIKQNYVFMSYEAIVVNYHMTPNYFLSESFMGGSLISKQLFDGNRLVVTSPGGKQEFYEGPFFDLAKQQAIFNADLKYKEIGIKRILMGIEKLSGKDVYKLQLISRDGSRSLEYYDVETGLKLKSMTDSGSAVYSEYKDFDGIKFPTKIVQEAGTQYFDIFIESVEINTGMKKEMFVIE